MAAGGRRTALEAGAGAVRPGAIPLRPLGLGDILDAAFRIIRRNAGATVGAAVLVAVGSMLLPLLLSAVLTFGSSDLSWLTADDGAAEFDDADLVGVLGIAGSLMIGGLLQGFGLLLVSGMATPVTLAAAVGRTMTMGEAWRATRGKRWRLVGLAFLVGLMFGVVLVIYVLPFVVILLNGADVLSLVLWGVVGTLVLAVVMVWGWTRLYVLQIPALMAEPVGIAGAIGRGFRLSSRQFWRIFGIALLTALMAGIGGQIISMPVGIASQLVPTLVDERYAALGLVLGQTFSAVVQAAFSTPVVAVVSALLYVDQRIRKEAFDVELMQQAGGV